MTQWLTVGNTGATSSARGIEGRLDEEDGKKCCEVKRTSRTMSIRWATEGRSETTSEM